MIKKKDLSIACLLKESASILEQASRSYCGLKLGVFVTKLGPFCTFSADTFWKIHRDVYVHYHIFFSFNLN